MKFLASLFGAGILGIVLFLMLGFALRCEHESTLKTFAFQPEKSTAASSFKVVCDKCNQPERIARFYGTPSDTAYVGVVSEHCKDKKFVSGEYDTVTATLLYHDYDPTKTQVQCKVREGDVIVGFSARFKPEYDEAVSLLKEGDEITFYGKSSAEGLFWSNCELVK